MRLTNEFTITTAPDRAYELLLDLRGVAPCIPGGEIGEADTEGVYPGRVSVTLGPMKFVYDGSVRISERDRVARTAVIAGEGRAFDGADTAKIRTFIEVSPDGDGSRVRMTTDLDIKGRAARLGEGLIADVSTHLIKQAAACLESRLAAPDGANHDGLPSSGPVGGISLGASLLTSKVGHAVRRLGRSGGDPT